MSQNDDISEFFPITQTIFYGDRRDQDLDILVELDLHPNGSNIMDMFEKLLHEMQEKHQVKQKIPFEKPTNQGEYSELEGFIIDLDQIVSQDQNIVEQGIFVQSDPTIVDAINSFNLHLDIQVLVSNQDPVQNNRENREKDEQKDDSMDQERIESREQIEISPKNSGASTQDSTGASTQHEQGLIKTFRSLKRNRTPSCRITSRNSKPHHKTKHFLPGLKRPFFKIMKTEKGDKFMNEHPIIRNIMDKTKGKKGKKGNECNECNKGINMNDYAALLRIPELKETWKKCFRTGYLYREVLLGRCEKNNKKVIVKYLNRMEKVFIEGKFLYIVGSPTVSVSSR